MREVKKSNTERLRSAMKNAGREMIDLANRISENGDKPWSPHERNVARTALSSEAREYSRQSFYAFMADDEEGLVNCLSGLGELNMLIKNLP